MNNFLGAKIRLINKKDSVFKKNKQADTITVVKNKKDFFAKKGFILLFSLLISSVILTAGLAVTRIMVKQIYLASVQRDSQMALYAADPGLDCGRYWYSTPIPGGPTPPAGAYCNLERLKKIGAGSPEFLDEVNKIQNGTTVSFNAGGGNISLSGYVVDPEIPRTCVKITFCNDGSGTDDCNDPLAKKGKIVARGYNVACGPDGNPEQGRVVERKLVYRKL
ncbi:MAG: hypothetical protein WCO84_01815 [bacterium]